MTTLTDCPMYRGRRLNPGDGTLSDVLIEVSRDQGVTWHPLRHVEIHSPTGMSWGYDGSGPADLAVSILADALQCADAVERDWRGDIVDRFARFVVLAHHDFKRTFVSTWSDEWSLAGGAILEWMGSHRLARIRETTEGAR